MSSLSPFAEREKIVLSLLLSGETTSGIADMLGVSGEKVSEIIQSIIKTLKDL
jgi:DNA-directed RNA polymerase specialized sigma subunit